MRNFTRGNTRSVASPPREPARPRRRFHHPARAYSSASTAYAAQRRQRVTIAFAAYALAVALSLFLAAHLSDWHGRRHVLMPALVLEILAGVVFMSGRRCRVCCRVGNTGSGSSPPRFSSQMRSTAYGR